MVILYFQNVIVLYFALLIQNSEIILLLLRNGFALFKAPVTYQWPVRPIVDLVKLPAF